MKYVVLTITAVAEPVILPGDPYGSSPSGTLCWGRYEYHVGGKTYLGPGGCTDQTPDGRFRVLYKRSNPRESMLDDISELIKDGILWIAFGGLLGWWAHRWRSRSVAIHGRAPPGRQMGSGAWGLFVLLGVSAALARDIADTREGFCSSRRAMLTNSMVGFLNDHERRFPRDWLRAFQANVDKDGVLTGSPECLAATQLSELARVCSGGFHITAEGEIGSPVCEFSGSVRYKVDIEFLTDQRNQTVNIRLLDVP